MKIKAPFQVFLEHAGQGFDGRRAYFLQRWVLRAYQPMHDKFGVLRVWRCKFVAYVSTTFKNYEVN